MVNEFRGKYKFLSNFYPQPIVYKGKTYKSSEHAYQAAKAISDKDHNHIAAADSCGEAKRRGKNVIMRSNWEYIKYSIMEDILRIKFKNTTLRNLLLETGNEELIEGNTWHDMYWGVCNCGLHRGTGANWLGKALMVVRTEIRNESIKIKNGAIT